MSADEKTRQRRAKTTKERVCPICAKPRDPRYDPFCSKRCADIDLHRWLKGSYVIPGDRGTEGGEGEE